MSAALPRNLDAGEPFPPTMTRLIAAAGIALATLVVAVPASAADRCRPRAGEHRLARSAQAVVLERVAARAYPFPRQTLTGCSRTSGRRRTIAVLQRRTAADPTRLVGLRLAGTRVAYVALVAPEGFPSRRAVVADDALHGGRRHDLSDGWPYIGSGDARVAWWAVDADGDVAWLTTDDAGVPSLVAWRPGLGRRQVDARADLRDPRLFEGRLSWRRDDVPRSVDLAAVAPSSCGGAAGDGTLEVDVRNPDAANGGTACLRATGRTVALVGGSQVLDVNGAYLILQYAGKTQGQLYWVDLVSGTAAGPGSLFTVPDAVVDEHGSVAWIRYGGGLWVHDAAGTRAVPGPAGTGPLLRDGATVTWSGGGSTVTLDP